MLIPALPPLLLLAVLAAPPAAGAVRLGLFLEAPAGTPATVLDSFRTEVETVLSRPGVQLQWREDLDGNEAFHRVLVIRLRGSCSTELPDGLGRPSALGSTHVSNGRVQPFIEISCSQVISALSRQWSWPAGGLSGELFGKALARVASHEIVHALTESVEHDEVGLMKPAFDRHDLCSAKLRLTPATIARLDRSLGLGGPSAD